MTLKIFKDHKSFFIKLLINIGFWTILSILTSTYIYFEGRTTLHLTWFQAFLRYGMIWELWIIFTPFVLYFSNRFFFKTGTWKKTLGIHFLLSMFICFTYVIIILFFMHPDQPFIQVLKENFYRSFYLLPQAFVVYWGILGIGHSLKYYNIYRDRELKSIELEKNLLNSQLQNLKSQLQPHFLFNTMHTIANLVRKKSYDTAIDTIAGFSDLLRMSLDDSDMQFVTLKDELQFIKLYLDIEKIRFKDRLTVQFETSSEILNSKVPFLTLQPIVENSIKHGITRYKKAEEIIISARRDEQNIIIEISDNGPGLPEDFSLEQSDGLGLKNLKKRLSILYDNNFTFDIRKNTPSGVNVILTLPVSAEERENE